MPAAATPTASVIIPCYNAAATLPRQLEALATQSDAPPFEVIVANNRSTDGIDAALSPWLDDERLDLRVVRADAAQGASYARNVGIGQARADILLFCDADDVVSRWFVAHGVRTCQHVPIWSGTVIELPEGRQDLTTEGARLLMDEQPTWAPPENEQDGAFQVLLGGCFGATREAMARIGGFDQSLPSAYEDNDVAVRATRAGYSVPVSKVVRIGFHNDKSTRERLRIGYRSARAHTMLASRYNLWANSHMPPWYRAVPSAIVAPLRSPRPRTKAQWRNVAIRGAIACGLAVGTVRHRYLHKLPTPQVGKGWDRSAGTTDDVTVSVIIPALNAAQWLPEQIAALEAQTFNDPFEVVIADNGSTDGTQALLTRYDGPLTIRRVDASDAPGASGARNAGAQAAHGEFLAFCDADDDVAPGWLAALMCALRAAGDVLVASALHHERFNDSDVRTAYGISPDPGDGIPSSHEAAYVDAPPPYAGHLPTVPAGGFACRRETYLRLGGMDADFPFGAEETDFAWRAQAAGIPVVSAPRSVVHYRLKSTPRPLARQQRLQQRERIRLWMKYGPEGMNGPSAKASAIALLKAARPARKKNRADRLRRAYLIGAHAGALEGMLRYRLLPTVKRHQHRLMAGR